jgi:4-hydroxy-tetrahydrodipicolinate reductase
MRAILARTHPDVVIHVTASFFHTVYPQILEYVQARANVISTCEELVYPYGRNAAAATQMHQRALRSGVTVLGMGVNPGFIMDVLPLLLTAPCVDIRRIAVTRVVDATQRRASLHQRIGAGCGRSRRAGCTGARCSISPGRQRLAHEIPVIASRSMRRRRWI